MEFNAACKRVIQTYYNNFRRCSSDEHQCSLLPIEIDVLCESVILNLRPIAKIDVNVIGLKIVLIL